jgi:hypothetical protein
MLALETTTPGPAIISANCCAVCPVATTNCALAPIDIKNRKQQRKMGCKILTGRFFGGAKLPN